MPIKLMKGDITKVKADAIVNAANNELTPGCGVCGAIFGAAGCAQLEWACRAVGHCDTGAAVITDGFALPARYVIHTVGPVWQGGGHGEADLLRSCYQSAVRLAARHDCRSLAFPLISWRPLTALWRKTTWPSPWSSTTRRPGSWRTGCWGSCLDFPGILRLPIDKTRFSRYTTLRQRDDGNK